MNHEETIFEQALGIDSEQAREEFLRSACAGNEALLQRLQGLLSAYDRAGKFLEHVRSAGGVGLSPTAAQFGVPPLGGAATRPAEAGTPSLLTEQSGDRIGRYKLLQKIGEGGCGVVYMAEQEEPVRRRVALKIIKLGMDTRQVIARFEAERQALALMDHPNIAKVFDAGVMAATVAAGILPAGEPGFQPGGEEPAHGRVHGGSHEVPGGMMPPSTPGGTPATTLSAGRPYFVMELVRGVKITEYCDEKKLTTQQRLELFTQVCRAVQHAHQKGIIHRDLKPSNILVSLNDGVAVPKVIDFGIAKATTGEPLTDKTVFTAFEQFIGTPAYMSPEQALVTSLDIDTRTDIYALGVLLYELLTGHTPFDAKELMQAGLDEMRRTIREKEPARPSTRVTDLVAADVRRLSSKSEIGNHKSEIERASSRRRLQEKERLVSQLRGDLDWIVMKCLEKDRARRYETANGLATDIQRHLNNEPVVACPPSNLYRVQKLMRRHKVAFAAGSGIAAALLMGLAVALWQSIEKTRAYNRAVVAEKAAQEEAAIAQAVNEFLGKDLLQQADSASQEDGGLPPNPQLTVREALERAAARIGERFKEQPLVEAAVRTSIGTALHGVGEADRAIPHLQRALELRRARLGPDHSETLLAMNALAGADQASGKLDQAVALFEETLKLQRAKLGPDHPETMSLMNNLAAAYRTAGKLDQAVLLNEETLKLKKARLGPDDPGTLISMNNLATAYQRAGKLDLALPLLEDVLRLRRAKLGPDNLATLNSMNNLALAYKHAGKLDQALPLFEETLNLQKAKLGPDHPVTLTTMNNLATAYWDAGKVDQALALHEETLKLRRAKLGPDHPDTLSSMNNLALAYHDADRLDEALPLFEETRRLTGSRLGPEHPYTLTSMNNLALAYHDTGKLDLAQALYEEVLKLQKSKLGPDHPDTLITMNNLAVAYKDAGNLDQALPMLEETLRLTKAKLGPDHPGTLSSMNNLALAYQDGGKLDLALPLYEETLKLQKAKLGPDHPDTLSSMNNLGTAYQDAGKFNKALPLLEQSLNLSKAKLGPGHPDTLKRLNNLALTYQDAGKFDQALPLFEEALQRIKQRDGPQSAACGNALASLGQRLLKRQHWVRAEPLLRECLGIREKIQPDEWTTFSARSMLGSALLGQQKLLEAQPLVVAGYYGLKERADKIPKIADVLNDAMDRLEVLYESCQGQPEAAKWKSEIEQVRHVTDEGAIRRWLILTPIALAAGQWSAGGLDLEQLSNEANLRPRQGDRISIGGRDLFWREYPLKDYAIDFNRLLGEETPRSVAYAVCYLRVSASRKDLVLKVGSDDQARVYLNGKKIYEQSKVRALRLDEDTVSGVELDAGLNVVVFKVVNGEGNWRGSIRLADKDDRPVPGIQVTLEPD